MHSNGECVMATDHIIKSDTVLYLDGEPANVDRVWLLSIRYSGTHYMWKYLAIMGYQRCVVFWETMAQKHPTTRKQYVHAHLEVGFEYQDCLTTEKCVMPLRNPIEVFKTHVYRHRWDARQYEPYILNAFKRFAHVVANHNVFVFRVDAKDQEAEFYRLGKFLDSDGAYVYQEKNVATSRTRPVSLHQGFTVAQVNAFHNPPESILELAKQYGY